MEKHNRSNRAAKELLLAEMVYKTAVEKHRTEKTEVSRSVVAEAYQQFLEVQRNVMVASWDPNIAELVPCPRCKKPTLARYWQRSPASTTPASTGGLAPGEDASATRLAPGEGAGTELRRPKRAIPKWATKLADRGANRVTRYGCDNCGFEISLVT